MHVSASHLFLWLCRLHWISRLCNVIIASKVAVVFWLLRSSKGTLLNQTRVGMKRKQQVTEHLIMTYLHRCRRFQPFAFPVIVLTSNIAYQRAQYAVTTVTITSHGIEMIDVYRVVPCT